MTRLLSLLNENRLSFYDDAGGVNRLQGLYELIKENFTSDFEIAEVGSFQGKSTELFALTTKKVWSIDPYLPYVEIDPSFMQDAEQQLLNMMQNYNNIQKIKKTSMEACILFEDNSLDAVYIDGAHDFENIKLDIFNWLPKVKVGGYISGHDYTTVPVIKYVVDNIFPNHDIKVYQDSSWIVKKI